MQCQNEVRDFISIVYKDVLKEPVVQEANDTEYVPSLITDLSIKGA